MPTRPKKTTMTLHADPKKVRRVWKINPNVRVKPADRRKRLDLLRTREAQRDIQSL